MTDEDVSPTIIDNLATFDEIARRAKIALDNIRYSDGKVTGAGALQDIKYLAADAARHTRARIEGEDG